MDSEDAYDVADYYKRFHSTFVQIQNKETKKTEVGYLRMTEPLDGYWEGVLTTDTAQKITSKHHSIISGFPPVGVTNCGKEVVITYRIPARQWKRGICADNFGIANPLHDVLSVTHTENIIQWPITYHEMDPHTLQECYNNTFFPIKEAIQKVQNLERFGAAVNNVFWFSPSWYNQHIILWYKETIVGEYKKDKLIVIEKAFKQEIKDVFGEVLCLI